MTYYPNGQIKELHSIDKGQYKATYEYTYNGKLYRYTTGCDASNRSSTEYKYFVDPSEGYEYYEGQNVFLFAPAGHGSYVRQNDVHSTFSVGIKYIINTGDVYGYYWQKNNSQGDGISSGFISARG